MTEQLIITPLENAFQSLRNTIQVLSDIHWFRQQPEIIQDTLIAGSIQKFEFVYELSLKMMKRQLALEATNIEAINSADFRDVLRTALQSGLIDNMDNWLFYRKMRNITLHTYEYEKATEVYEAIPDFLHSSHYLIIQLQQRNYPNFRQSSNNNMY